MRIAAGTKAKNMNAEMRTFIARVVAEVLNDADFGMALTAEAQKRLRKARQSRAKRIPFAEVRRRYL